MLKSPRAQQAFLFSVLGIAILLLVWNLPAVWKHQSNSADIGQFSFRYLAFAVTYSLLVISAAAFTGWIIWRLNIRGTSSLLSLAPKSHILVVIALVGSIYWRVFLGRESYFIEDIALSFSLLFIVAAITNLPSLLVHVSNTEHPLTRNILKKWLPGGERWLRSLLTSEKVNSFDIVFVLAVAIYALISFLGRWRGIVPFIFIHSDPANIASFIAGRTYPELFAHDAVLQSLDSYRVYWTVHLPLILGLSKITRDFGTAFVALYAPHVIVQAIGFYLLGWELFRNRLWAAILSAMSLLPVFLGLGEFWGIYDVMPRLTFQALLPFMLYLLARWQNTPSKWHWLMIFAGLLTYVHPVSAPVWAVAIWLCFWFLRPKDRGFASHAKHVLVLGLLVIVIIIPFGIHYLQNFEHGAVTEYEQVRDVMEYRFASGYLDLRLGVSNFLVGLLSQEPDLFIIGGLGWVLLRNKNEYSRSRLGLMNIIIVAILTMSVIVPLADHTVAQIRGELPLQLDLVRGLRYLVPILIIFSLWGLKEFLEQNHGNRLLKFMTAALCLVWLGTWSIGHPPIHFAKAILCWMDREFICPIKSEEADYLAVAQTIATTTPPGSTVMVFGANPLPIRYYALRSVPFALKDGGIFGYANHIALLNWYESAVEYNEIIALDNADSSKTERALVMSYALDADYMLVSWPVDARAIKELDAHIIFKNDSYVLTRISSTAK